MATRVGTGIISKNSSAELELLRQEVSTLRTENEILRTEKSDLEKLPEELSNQVKELLETKEKKNKKDSE